MNTHHPVKQAVILAAGRGRRLGALTDNVPKPMLSIGGAPAIGRVLSGLKASGITQAIIVVGYRAEIIQDFFANGEQFGLAIRYITQTSPNGTAAALGLARDQAHGEAVLMTYGDIITDEAHYRSILAMYESTESAAVIGINPVDDPAAGAAVYRDGDRVTRIVEKPPAGTSESNWNQAGVFVFGPTIWDAIETLKPSVRGEYEITDAILALMRPGNTVRACEMTGFWSDIGTPADLAAADAHFTRISVTND